MSWVASQVWADDPGVKQVHAHSVAVHASYSHTGPHSLAPQDALEVPRSADPEERWFRATRSV